MLSILTITLKKPEQIFLTQNISSILQGVLMEVVDHEYGEELHRENLKPYSQYVIFSNKEITWKIMTLDEMAYQKINKKLHDLEMKSIYLRYKKLELEILNKELICYENQALIEENFFGSMPRRVSVQFTSPTAFKSNGEYVFYPSIPLIFNSLIKKFDAFNEDNSIGSEELLNDICENVKIIDYRIRSKKFHLEGVTIPAFLGEVTFLVKGPQQLANVVNLLLRYGEFSGVGIKAAIGMGSIQMIERKQ